MFRTMSREEADSDGDSMSGWRHDDESEEEEENEYELLRKAKMARNRAAMEPSVPASIAL